MAESKAEKRRKLFQSHAMDMEAPLRDATRYVLALRLMGEGLDDREQGETFATVALAASHSLEALTELWDKAFDAARR